MQDLQVDQPIPLQSRVAGSPPACSGLLPPLAPVYKKLLKPTSYKMVHVPKHLPRIPIAKVVCPSSQDHIDFLNHFPERLLVSATGLSPDFVPKSHYGLLRGKDIQIPLVPSLPIPVVAKGKPQEVQGFTPLCPFARCLSCPDSLPAQGPIPASPLPILRCAAPCIGPR